MNSVLEREPDRLAALDRYDVRNARPEPALDRITDLAARLFDVPIAIVCIVDSARIWVKSRHGMDVDSVEPEPGFCASAIHQDGPWVIPDARADERTAKHSFVVGAGIRFYAGAPLKTRDDLNLGTLSVLDRRPRRFTSEDLEPLTELAALVMDELELRLLRAGRSPHPDVEHLGVAWEEPPAPKGRTVEDWAPILTAVACRPGVWAKIAHYSGETSAYRAASQLRRRDDLPAGDWEFAARRAEPGSDLYARVLAGS